MPDLNDDMDELFKKAAEHYPLNTNSGDWNEVQKALPSLDIPLIITTKKNRSRRFLWLLLLLPLLVLVNKYVSNRGSKELAATKNNAAISLKQTYNIEKKSAGNLSPKSLLKRKTTVFSSKNVVGNNRPQKLTKTATGHLYTNKNSNRKSSNTIKNNYQKNGQYRPGIVINANNSDDKKYKIVSNTAGALLEKINEEGINENDSRLKINQNAESKIDTPENAIVKSAGNPQPHGLIKVNKTKIRNTHFYVGIIGGLDATAVKFQKINKTGLSGGILAGYKLNARWSIESGFYLDKKYYYTEGKYFTTKAIYIPPYSKIVDLTGNCYMIEVPLNVKYDFKSTKKGNWFALAGSSSYLMKKEDYTYKYISNYGQQWDKKASYKNSSKNWLAIINLGAGYNRNIGKTTKLRIEPYIKIPFKGIGIGTLPITSAGIYLGFTKNLF